MGGGVGGVEAGVDVVELGRAEEGEGEVDGWNLTSRAEESNCHTVKTINQVKREGGEERREEGGEAGGEVE